MAHDWLIRQAHPVIIYTDGSCLSNPGGRGGWAAILLHKGHKGEVVELSGSVPESTNNRMEMMAALKALESLPTRSTVFVYTDSKYVLGILKWVPLWKKRGWTTVDGRPVANQDLWMLLDAENSRHIIEWVWVRGHDGDAYNERCDVLAKQAAQACPTNLLTNSPE